MSNPFDYVTSITYGKNDMMTGSENDELSEESYNPYLSNKALSYFPDTLLYANEMNLMNHVDKKLQYSYLLFSIRPKKRFSKWMKKNEDTDIDTVKQYYKCNSSRAEEILKILSADQLKELEKRLTKGG
jgi:hypothetical protein